MMLFFVIGGVKVKEVWWKCVMERAWVLPPTGGGKGEKDRTIPTYVGVKIMAGTNHLSVSYYSYSY